MISLICGSHFTSERALPPTVRDTGTTTEKAKERSRTKARQQALHASEQATTQQERRQAGQRSKRRKQFHTKSRECFAYKGTVTSSSIYISLW